ncbi:hypothetical protein B6D29_00080 [Microgenomates bacterium UTCPR1]|nr:MAG: hypothetical protein B6D29_00080 [Microgenomates bacterium UTCPR1]
MKIKYPVNYSGYVPILRSVLLLPKTGIISISQLGIYICFIMQTSFDPRHRHYKAILRSDEQLANEFGVNKTTIYRARKALIKVGLLMVKADVTYVPNYYLFELDKVKKVTKLPIEKLHELFANPHKDFSELQQDRPQKTDQNSTVSSNVDTSFTDDDREWINKNLKEDTKEEYVNT